MGRIAIFMTPPGNTKTSFFGKRFPHSASPTVRVKDRPPGGPGVQRGLSTSDDHLRHKYARRVSGLEFAWLGYV